MPIYNDKPYLQTYVFYELFENDPAWDGLTYATKYLAWEAAITDLSMGLITLPSAEAATLLDLLYLRYSNAHIRYMSPLDFLLGLFRKLHVAWPIYKEQQTIITAIRALTVADIMNESKTLRNLVNNPNDPVTDPDTTPIPDLSTEQESMLTTSNVLQANLSKMEAVRRNAFDNFWKALDPLFQVILSDDTVIVYPVP